MSQKENNRDDATILSDGALNHHPDQTSQAMAEQLDASDANLSIGTQQTVAYQSAEQHHAASPSARHQHEQHQYDRQQETAAFSTFSSDTQEHGQFNEQTDFTGNTEQQHAKKVRTSTKRTVLQYLDAVPLSTRLVSIILVLLLASSAVVGFAVRQLVGSYIIDKTDTQLMRQSELVLNNINTLQQSDRTDSMGLTDYYLQLRDSHYVIQGTPLIPVLSDGVSSAPVLPPSGSIGNIQIGQPFTTNAAVQIIGNSSRASVRMANAPWRVLAVNWTVPEVKNARGEVITQGAKGVAFIGLSLYDMQDTMQIVTKYFIAVGVATALLATVLASMVIERTLRPLKRIEKTAAQIANGDLSQRVPQAPENTEVGSLSRSLNRMLSRIESSFIEQQRTTEKMKRFVSDASHELRTPLATIHGYAELYRMQRNYPGALERADESIKHIEQSSSRMSALVEDLLSLARMDEGRGVDLTQRINITRIVHDAREDLHALNPERPIDLGSLEVTQIQTNNPEEAAHRLKFIQQLPPDLWMYADQSRLRQVVTNIVGNIHRYTPQDSPVEMALSLIPAYMTPQELASMNSSVESLDAFVRSAQYAAQYIHDGDNATQDQQMNGSVHYYAVLRIIDHGPGLQPHDLHMIFERFYTADLSRAREKGGTGLGMAIAQSAVKAHHGLICASHTPQGGLTFTVVLPADSNSLTQDQPTQEKHS